MTGIHRNESSSLTSDVDDAATDQDNIDTTDSEDDASTTNSTNSDQDSEGEVNHGATAAVGILKLDPPDVPNKNMLSVADIEPRMVRTTTDHETNELVIVVPKDTTPPEKRNRYRLWTIVIVACGFAAFGLGTGIGFLIGNGSGDKTEIIEIPEQMYFSVFLDKVNMKVFGQAHPVVSDVVHFNSVPFAQLLKTTDRFKQARSIKELLDLI